MPSNNLALMFCPNLYPPELFNTLRKATRQKSGNLKVEVVKHMIDHYSYIFGETDQLPSFDSVQAEDEEEEIQDEPKTPTSLVSSSGSESQESISKITTQDDTL